MSGPKQQMTSHTAATHTHTRPRPPATARTPPPTPRLTGTPTPTPAINARSPCQDPPYIPAGTSRRSAASPASASPPLERIAEQPDRASGSWTPDPYPTLSVRSPYQAATLYAGGFLSPPIGPIPTKELALQLREQYPDDRSTPCPASRSAVAKHHVEDRRAEPGETGRERQDKDDHLTAPATAQATAAAGPEPPNERIRPPPAARLRRSRTRLPRLPRVSSQCTFA